MYKILDGLYKVKLDYDKLYDDSTDPNKDALKSMMLMLEEGQDGGMYGHIVNGKFIMLNTAQRINTKYIKEKHKIEIDQSMEHIAKLICEEVEVIEEYKKTQFYEEFEKLLKTEYDKFLEKRKEMNND